MTYKSKPFRKKYGFMGINTQLNGLTNWIDKHIILQGDPFKKSDALSRMMEAIGIVIEYGRQNIPGFSIRNDAVKAAEYVARWVNNNGTIKVSGFLLFTQWVFKHYPKNQPS